MVTDPMNGPPRRLFIREAARRALAPLVDFVEQRVALRDNQAWLRPPGAIAEEEFVHACQRCGACVEACPADAIFSLSAGSSPSAGTPVIDADRAACVVCDGLQCTQVCPSGALRPLQFPHQIHMGLAEVYDPLCVRSDAQTCTLCVDRCPLGEDAIRFVDTGPPRVFSTGCTGCGVCQLACPTTPKAIVVIPARSQTP